MSSVGLKSMSQEIPALVIAYNKPTRFFQLVQSLISFGFKEFWFFVDGPANLSTKEEQDQIFAYISILQNSTCFKVHIKKSLSNLTGPKAIPKAINWFFSSITAAVGCVFEEDLLLLHSPSEFIDEVFYFSEHIPIAGGCLFSANRSTESQLGYLFDPWGWFMTPHKWFEINKIIPDYFSFLEALKLSDFTAHMKHLWISKYIDIYHERGSIEHPRHWDYDFNIKLIISRQYFAFPSVKYVVNQGFGHKAQNTRTLPDYFSHIVPQFSNTLTGIRHPLVYSSFKAGFLRFHFYRSFPPRLVFKVFLLTKQFPFVDQFLNALFIFWNILLHSKTLATKRIDSSNSFAQSNCSSKLVMITANTSISSCSPLLSIHPITYCSQSNIGFPLLANSPGSTPDAIIFDQIFHYYTPESLSLMLSYYKNFFLPHTGLFLVVYDLPSNTSMTNIYNFLSTANLNKFPIVSFGYLFDSNLEKLCIDNNLSFTLVDAHSQFNSYVCDLFHQHQPLLPSFSIFQINLIANQK